MKIAIIGYGKMGKMIEKAALDAGHAVVCIVEPLAAEQCARQNTVMCKSIEEAKGLNGADLAIEFTRPDTAVANISALVQQKIPVVVGTTGWYDKLNEVKKMVDQAGTPLLWSANYSMGVNVFYRVAWFASALIDSFPEYDIGGFEAHHNKKIDSPSGTAKILVEGVLSRIKRKKKIVWETVDRQIQADELHYPSLRMGSVPGTHSLIFDSNADTIEITHRARNREALAAGAVRAAQWLTAEKRSGVFTIDDMLKDMLGI